MAKDNPSVAEPPLDGIAIIGMSGRFPGARTVAEFWRRQRAGLESISLFSPDELEVAGGQKRAADPNYVRARSILADVDLFDAEFFGITPRDATVMDPQHRLFLESCWEAIEQAGYDPAVYPGAVGVFAGCSVPTYLLAHLCKQPGFIDRVVGDYQTGSFAEILGNGLDFLTTRVAYKMNLTGPTMTVLSACSTSLVAVTQAAQSLLSYQCDMALAGGASISLPQKRGTAFIEGGMTSPDGHCRAFDAAADGTVFGSGVGVVLLKRFDDAVRDRDEIYAVIRGYGLNNDGAQKIGFTAPSIEGQAAAIAQAYGMAGIDPASIGYIEAHGTGTPLGDPIELAALTRVFREATATKQFCTIGTAKTNVGHLDAAAGVTGLIHASLIIREGILPPTLHYQTPNPKFDLANSPFRVSTVRRAWDSDLVPRRAGVSAFGVGGTNAHVVLEEAPKVEPRRMQVPTQLLVLSARSEAALVQMRSNLAAHLKDQPGIDLGSVAWTLQSGRRRFQHAVTVVASDVHDAVHGLSDAASERRQQSSSRSDTPTVHFMFPGQGTQHPGMGRTLYATQSVFRTAIDHCAEILQPLLGHDLRRLLYSTNGGSVEAAERLKDTSIGQPAIFTIEYALAQLYRAWGITPTSMIGHSVGEFTAACLAGVFSLEDALTLVAARGQLMQSVAPGGMLSVRMSEAALRQRLPAAVAIAAVNAPTVTVVAGPLHEIGQLEAQLAADKISCRRLMTSHAFHSGMMDPVVAPFRVRLESVRLAAPQIPIVSTVTGRTLSDHEATDPSYWAQHLREPVRFSTAIAGLRHAPHAILLEVGPGATLNTLARQHAGRADQTIVSSLPGAGSSEVDTETLLQAMGALWLAGVKPDWPQLHASELTPPRRVPLPTYPFERKRFWLDVPDVEHQPNASVAALPPSTPTNDGLKGPNMQDQVHPDQRLAINAISDVPAIEAQGPPSRISRLRQSIVEVFEELSGSDLGASIETATFLDLGFDSLFLTQVTRAVQTKLGVKITFRQLLGAQNTFAALTAFVDQQLPPDAVSTLIVQASHLVTLSAPREPDRPLVAATPPKPQALAPNATALLPTTSQSALAARPVGDSAAERILREQINLLGQVFARQLDIVQGMSNVATEPVVDRAEHVAPPSIATALVTATNPDVTALPRTAAVSPPPLITATLQSPDPTAGPDFKAFGPYKPVQNKLGQALEEQQQRQLADITERYTRKTLKSKVLAQAHRKHLADPRAVSGFRDAWKELVYPVAVNRSRGSRLWDVDGNEYVDLLNGFGPILFGHRPEFIEAAIAKQLTEGMEIGPQTPLAGEIAELFCEITGNERMTFCNTGSEAVMAAMRVARTVTGRSKIVQFAGDYHGMFDEVLVKAGRLKNGAPQTAPIAPGIPRDNVANMIVLDYGTPESLAWIRQNANDLAAILVEPIQSRRPDFHPIAFLKELRAITLQSGTALVFDEVVTGFRTHAGGCQALFDIRCDMATYGKVLGGGMPIGVLAGTAQFMDALDGGQWQFGDASYPEIGVTFFAGTFVRHPLTLAAVKAVLTEVKRRGGELQASLAQRTTKLVTRINAVLERHGMPTQLKHFSSFFYFSFPTEAKFSSLFYVVLREHGVHVLEGFPCFVTTEHSDADINHIVRAFEAAAVEMRRGAFMGPALDPLPITALTSALANGTGPLPMTEPQREIFLAAMLGDDVSCAFNESFSIHLSGDLRVAGIEAALNTVIGRHGALRATITPDGQHLQTSAELVLTLPLVDLSTMGASERSEALAALLHADARAPFDLSAGPLLRAQLIRLTTDDHVLVVSAHHIVCDGWSANVMVTELAEVYSAHVEQRGHKLPSVLSFAHYAAEQFRNAETSDAATTAQYWLAQFVSPPALLDLPIDRPRGEHRTYAGATIAHQIGPDAARQIKSIGVRQQASLFATLFAGFNVLLHKLTGARDLVVGVPMAGQSRTEGGSLVGHCVNFLPLRLRVSADASFAATLQLATNSILDAYEHQSFTYGTLTRQLKLVRDPRRLPLTEVQFNVEQFGAGSHFSGLQTRLEPNAKAAVNFDLFFNVVESPDGLAIQCDYNTDLFNATTIEHWLLAYTAILSAAAESPHALIAGLPAVEACSQIHAPLTAAATDLATLETWNQTTTSYPRDASVVDVFAEQQAATPNAVAIVCGASRMSYRELHLRSNKIAHRLQRVGVKPNDTVAVCLERSSDLLVALLAVLKTGAAYVPLDPTFPRERLKFMIGDTAARVTITERRLADRGLSAVTASLLLVDEDAAAIDAESEQDLPRFARPQSLAYVMYTSGSTGLPKGVMIEHRSIVRLVKASNYCKLESDEVILQFAPISFDASTFEIWGAFLNGGRVVVMPPGEPSLADIGREIREHGVTTLWLTAGMFHVLVDQRLEDLAGLRQLLAGGDVLSARQVQQVLKGHPHIRLINGYGPTEGTTFSACHTFQSDRGDGDRVPIGKALSNTRLYVLDEHGDQVAIGIEGELFIAGDGLARGYLNNPELTAEKFVTRQLAPVGQNPPISERLYRTGDRVRFLENGTLEFLGRIDHQVKLRGFRIEPGEIESVLRQHQDVLQVCVVAEREGKVVKRLLAFCITQPNGRLTEAVLRQYLASSLPAHMVPAAIVLVASFPLTGNGKIDREALLTLENEQRAQRLHAAPETTDERILVEIVSEIMQMTSVGATDNLFEIGVDSLKIFQIASRAAKAGVAVTPRAVMQGRTIRAALAEAQKTPVLPHTTTLAIKPIARQRYRLN